MSILDPWLPSSGALWGGGESRAAVQGACSPGLAGGEGLTSFSSHMGSKVPTSQGLLMEVGEVSSNPHSNPSVLSGPWPRAMQLPGLVLAARPEGLAGRSWGVWAQSIASPGLIVKAPMPAQPPWAREAQAGKRWPEAPLAGALGSHAASAPRLLVAPSTGGQGHTRTRRAT